MFYYLFNYLEGLNFPGARMFHYISFRASLAIILSLTIGLIVGKRIIRMLQRQQIGEEIRDLGLEGQMQKRGTPTMGGLIILASIVIPVLLLGDLKNVYVQLMLITTVWLGGIGLLDDYIKVFKKNKEGLSGKFKILGQIGIGLIVGITLCVNDGVVVREKVSRDASNAQVTIVGNAGNANERVVYLSPDEKVTKTTIPFVKNNEFDYSKLVPFKTENKQTWGWVVFVLATILIVTAVSNGSNLTDGLDGLATSVSVVIGTTLGILTYLSGNVIYADYLHIMYIPNSGEMVIFIAAFIGALIGFLWYNTYPAQVFMGDTGSLAIGGIIAVSAIIIRKELLIPILCGVFFVESLSVMIQVAYFKYTKRKYGEGRRVFLMSPLHHHFQKKGYPEPKIVMRFTIVAIMLAVITIVTLKIR